MTGIWTGGQNNLSGTALNYTHPSLNFNNNKNILFLTNSIISFQSLFQCWVVPHHAEQSDTYRPMRLLWQIKDASPKSITMESPQASKPVELMALALAAPPANSYSSEILYEYGLLRKTSEAVREECPPPPQRNDSAQLGMDGRWWSCKAERSVRAVVMWSTSERHERCVIPHSGVRNVRGHVFYKS